MYIINDMGITGTIANYTVNPPLICDAMHITGGPQNTHDARLSPGAYYFQVADPSGKIVLSTDWVADRTRTMTTVKDNGWVTYTYGDHLNSDFNPTSGETAVKLWLFALTPNTGGMYKAWIST